jgi:hypothetical protein
LPYAWVNHRSRPDKGEQGAKLHSLGLRQWVVAHFQARDIPHRFTSRYEREISSEIATNGQTAVFDLDERIGL